MRGEVREGMGIYACIDFNILYIPHLLLQLDYIVFTVLVHVKKICVFIHEL